MLAGSTSKFTARSQGQIPSAHPGSGSIRSTLARKDEVKNIFQQEKKLERVNIKLNKFQRANIRFQNVKINYICKRQNCTFRGTISLDLFSDPFLACTWLIFENYY